MADIAAQNQKHATEAQTDDIGIDPISDRDRQIDMEKAIQQLTSMDADLIRMKYYQGKSLWEIANSLGISYEWSDLNTDISVLRREEYWQWYDYAQLGEGIGGRLDVNMNVSNWETGSFTTTYTLQDPQLIEDQEGMVCILLFDGAQICFRVSETESQELEQAGYSVITEEGGFYALPRIQDGHLYVQIYPIHPENYTIDRSLSTCYLKYQFGLSGEVTATAEDGTVLTGSINRNTEQISDAFYEWDFGEAEPGEYQLHIPFVFVYRNTDEQLAAQYLLPFTAGEAVTIPMPEGTITIDTVQALGQNEEGQYRWWLPMEIDTSCAYRLLSIHCFFLPQNAENLPENTFLSSKEITSEGAITGYECSCSVDLSAVQVRLQKISCLWECDTTIPIRANGD